MKLKILNYIAAALFVGLCSWLVFTPDLNLYNTMPGGLPWSDAISYVSGAVEFTQTGHLTGWACRRPPQHLINGFILMLSDFDYGPLNPTLKIATLLITLLMGLVIARLYSGLLAGLVVIGCLWFAKKEFWSTPLSESIGYFWGTLSFIFFHLYWNEIKKWWLLGLSVGLLWLAMYARASAILVLPVILIFGILRLNKQDRLKGLIKVLGVVLPFLIISSAVQSQICSTTKGFGNAYSTLYGLAVGGKGWTQVYKDFPNLASLGEAEQNEFIKNEFRKSVLDSPLNFVKGYFLKLKDFIVAPEILLKRSKDFILLTLAFIICIRSGRKRPNSEFGLQFAIGTAIIITAPILLDGAARVYAPLIGYFTFFMAWPWFKAFPQLLHSWKRPNITVLAATAYVLLIVSIFGPATVFLSSPLVPQSIGEVVQCPLGFGPTRAIILGNSEVVFSSQNSLDKKVSFVEPTLMRKWLENNQTENVYLSEAPNSKILSFATELRSYRAIFLVNSEKNEGQAFGNAKVTEGCMKLIEGPIYEFVPVAPNRSE